jgi:hypothetical protein
VVKDLLRTLLGFLLQRGEGVWNLGKSSYVLYGRSLNDYIRTSQFFIFLVLWNLCSGIFLQDRSELWTHCNKFNACQKGIFNKYWYRNYQRIFEVPSSVNNEIFRKYLFKHPSFRLQYLWNGHLKRTPTICTPYFYLHSTLVKF